MKFICALAFSDASHYAPLARACEEAGIWAIACSDHLLYPQDLTSPYPYRDTGRPPFEPDTPWLDPLVAISAMAAVTERLRFTTNIYVLPMRQPLHVAKQISSVAALSGDRIELGVGVGWMREEFDLVGEDFQGRGRRTDEMIALLRTAWASQGTWFEHHGEFYDIPPVTMNPSPRAPVPIHIGGISERAFTRAARLGDGWIGDLMTLEQARAAVERIEHWREHFSTRDRPFEYVVASADQRDAAGFRRLADVGVTAVLTQPWVYTRGFTDDIEARVAGTLEFGRQVVEPLSG